MATPNLKKATIIESALLKAMAVREHYTNYINYVAIDRLMPETKILLEDYKKYYEMYEHTHIDFNTFFTQFNASWTGKSLNSDDLHLFKIIITAVENHDIVDAETALVGLVNNQFINEINKLADNNFNADTIRKALDAYEIKYAGIVKDFDSDCFTSDNVDFESIDKSLGVPYALEPLQDALGGMIPGSLVTINAASGIGKSAFVYTQLAHTFEWLNQRGDKRPILFFNTEGPLSEVFAKFWSCLYRNKVTGGYYEVIKLQDKVRSNFEKKYNKNLLLGFQASYMGINYVRAKIKKYKPALVVLDMAAAIMTPMNKSSSDVGNLEGYFQALRKLSSENCPILATVQAGNGAKWWDKDDHCYKYKEWPTDDDIYGSKSAVQGASETIITIGRDNMHENTRYIQTTKVKSLYKAKFICEMDIKYNLYDVVRVLNSNGG